MLARRFTIVCLLMSLFGMLFAVLVAEAGRPAPGTWPFPAGSVARTSFATEPDSEILKPTP